MLIYMRWLIYKQRTDQGKRKFISGLVKSTSKPLLQTSPARGGEQTGIVSEHLRGLKSLECHHDANNRHFSGRRMKDEYYDEELTLKAVLRNELRYKAFRCFGAGSQSESSV